MQDEGDQGSCGTFLGGHDGESIARGWRGRAARRGEAGRDVKPCREKKVSAMVPKIAAHLPTLSYLARIPIAVTAPITSVKDIHGVVLGVGAKRERLNYFVFRTLI